MESGQYLESVSVDWNALTKYSCLLNQNILNIF
jgi:hypothetical protein